MQDNTIEDRARSEQAEQMADLVVERLLERQQEAYLLSYSEQMAVKDLLRTKRNAVRAFLCVCGALFLWIVKDAYLYLLSHITFK